MPITEEEVAALSQAMAEVMREILPEYVAKAVAPLEATVRRLDTDLETLQTKSEHTMRYKGV